MKKVVTVLVLSALLVQLISGSEKESFQESRSTIDQGIKVQSSLVSNERSFDRNNFPGDYFYVWFCFWCHNGIQVRLTLKTARDIEKNILEKSYKEGTYYLRGRFSYIPTDDSETAKLDDINHAAKVLRDGFDEFRKALKSATAEEYIFIQTYRSYNYWETRTRLEPENQVIYAARRPQI